MCCCSTGVQPLLTISDFFAYQDSELNHLIVEGYEIASACMGTFLSCDTIVVLFFEI